MASSGLMLLAQGLAEGWLSANLCEVVEEGLEGLSVALKGFGDGIIRGEEALIRIGGVALDSHCEHE